MQPSNQFFSHFSFSSRIPFLLIIFSLPQILSAQGDAFDRYKIEDVEKEDFSVQNEVIDEYASAVYLFDLGESRVEVTSSAVKLEFTRTFRLKILSEQGLSLADQIIALYVGSKLEEEVGRVKGGVYNLENGKIKYEKLRNDDWFTEPYDINTKYVRLTFKNVKVGSIIELSYTIFSPFVFRMPDWEFQYDKIPVLYTEYFIRFPDFIGYKILRKGSQPCIGNFHTTEMRPYFENGVFIRDVTYHVYGMACENVPGLRQEPLMDSPENYRSRVITELYYVDFPNEPPKYYNKDWHSSIHDFMKEEFNDRYMNPKDRYGYFTFDSANCTDKIDSVRTIYDEIRSSYTNSEAINFLSPKRNPREVIESKKATASEINWILISTLRANGIDAYPVLASIRSRQRVLKDYPIFTQFSTCLAAVKTDSAYFLLDASSPIYKPGEISEQYYNGDGLVANEQEPIWMPIKSISPTSEKCIIELNNLEGNTMTGTMSLILSGIYRTRIGNSLRHIEKSELKNLLHIANNAEITLNSEKSNLDVSPMELNFDLKLTLEKIGDSYLLPAVIYDDMSNNVLKEKKRLFPVNFPDSWSESYTCLVHLNPDEYDVTLPENTSLVLPNQDARFSYLGSYNFGSLVIRNKIEMNKTTFEPAEYPTLRQFYDLISTTHSSFIEITAK